MEKYLIHYKDRLQGCDGVIWESGIIDEKGRAIIELGVKGILSVELIAKGPLTDAHSSLAVLIENPAWNLVRALNTLYDNGKILIRDWYKEIKEFTSAELDALANEPFDEQEFKKEYGIGKFANDLKDIEEIKRALAGKPTCNIAGIVSGYSGEGAKTVLPSTAMVKLDFRLVPDMIPRKQLERLNNHFKEYRFSDNNIEIKFLDGVPPFRTPIDHPLVKLVEEAAIEVFNTAIISVSSAGTGPMYYFDKVLGTV